MDITYQIPRRSLIWVLMSVVMALAPHVLRLPAWISLVAAGCIIWRVLIFLGKLDYPGRLLRVLVVLFILVGSASQLRSLDIGLDVAASLLALGFIFKLVEMQSKRDIYVVLCLGFIMALVSLIYSQSMVTSMYLTLMTIVIIGSMVSLNRTAPVGKRPATLGVAVKITAQSLPLMIVLFLVFPRIGPLWAVPTQSTSTTGVSEQMSPGDISQLAQSTDLAFRVTFENGPPPLHENLYWRGLVLDYFDGASWSRQGRSALSAAAANAPVEIDYQDRVNVAGTPVSYNVIMEPSQQRWIFGLHLAEPLSPQITRGRNFELLNRTPINQRLSYNLRSYRNNQTDLLLLNSIRRRSLALPEGGNPRSRELAQSLRANAATDRDYAFAVMALFQQQFSYTLSPPLLGAERVDEFLFGTRAGYCEHFASAFTFMMRAGGVPARVVVGYQGGEYNRFENYTMVYQYNAHAWSEIWLEGEGWVRFDPTSIVAPERISDGFEAALGDDPNFLNEARFSLARFRGAGWMNNLRLRLDALEYLWNRRVVSYNIEQQSVFFEQWFGNSNRTRILTVLAVSSLLTVAAIALLVVRRRPRNKMRLGDVLYREYCHHLARIGLPRRAGEAPLDYCRRVADQRPDLERSLSRLTGLYMEIAYQPGDDPGSARTQELKRLLRDFRSQLARRHDRVTG
ncbi:MAG: DUF3488 and transglutaminase-like domain-containing protein [Gammaproteobacteria bacterium]